MARRSTGSNDSINSNTELLDDHSTKPNASFIASKTLGQEMKIILSIFIKIALSNIAELFPQILSNIFIGHLNNASFLLSACGLARTFCNVMGLAQAWAFSSALYILIPQCLGADQPQLMAIHVQRAFWVCLCVAMVATVMQFFGGEIMCLIGEPNEFCEVISIYCRALIPMIYGSVLLTICQRIGQALDFNTYLFYSVLIPAVLALPLNYLFVYYLDFGYIGTAIVIDISFFLSLLLTFISLVYKGYCWVFIPLPFSEVFQFDGMKQYILLALPGLAQSSMTWIISEMLVVFSGFIANPSLVVASTVVCASLNTFITMTSVGMGNAVNIRLGKYIGAGLLYGAKRVAKCTIIANSITMLCFAVVLYVARDSLIKIWTHEANVVELASSLVVIALIPRMLSFNLYIVMSGTFRGLGYPQVTAYVVLVSHYCIGLPIGCVLLFYFDLRAYSNYGLYTLWWFIGFGYFLSSIILIGILVFKIDLQKAVSESLMRIKRTTGYGSCQKQSKAKRDQK